MRRITLSFVLVVVALTFGFAEGRIKEKNILKEKEYLQYKVSYAFLRVGTLKVFNYGKETVDGYHGYHVKIFIDSNPKIPFVKVHDIYETVMNENFEPIYFIAWEQKDDHLLKTTYEFNYSPDSSHIRAKEIKIVEEEQREVLQTDSIIPIDTVYRDAISLLFYARHFADVKSEKTYVPIIALLKKENCYFDNSGVVKEIKFNDSKIDTYYLDGKLKFIGIVGIKDDFKGWFSSDEQRVPVVARMKAFFGSIKIELEEYQNWEGPLRASN
ncbi:MAG: hypothetical protein Kow00108_19210 [Calditrichia bacterium]